MMSEWRTHLVKFSREWWKERLPLIQAFAEGRPIEYYQFGWVERTTSSFSGSIQNYRVAEKIFAVNPKYPEGYLEKSSSDVTKDDLLFETKKDALEYLAANTTLTKALKDASLICKSIEHWVEVFKDPENTLTSYKTCPLCGEYNQADSVSTCAGCPIFLRTGKVHCKGTPYTHFEEFRTRENALIMINFLRELL